MQTETYCGIKPLTDKDIKDLVKSEADNLDFETTFNYLFDLSNADEADIKDAAPIEKIMWVVRHAHLNGLKKGITVYNDVVRQVLEEDNMKVDDIKIYPCFAAHSPKAEKMERKEQYFTEIGLLQSQIILDSRGNLIDGYTSYLLAVKHGIQLLIVK